MPRVSPFFLALLLLLQWSTAFGHCQALKSEGLSFPICTAHAEDLAAPASSQDKQTAKGDWDCPACHQVPLFDNAAMPSMVAVAFVWAERVAEWQSTPTSPLGARAPPPPARAPPTA